MDLEFPVKFTEDEYNKNLGLYQKWICGNKDQQIEKLYSFSAFQVYNIQRSEFITHDYQKYAEYLYLTATAIINNTTSPSTEYYIRIYIDESLLNPLNPDKHIWNNKLTLLQQLPRVQIICVKFPSYYLPQNCHQELVAVMFRYLSLFDSNVSIILFRDLDNIYTNQHQYFIDTWLARGDDLCFYMNDNYRRQEVIGLTQYGTILEDMFYTTILSGIWNIKKPMEYVFPTSLWQKIFAYIEDYTKCTSLDIYKNYAYYKTKFTYGFDELALTRVAVPIFLQMGMTTYAIPTRIYDTEYFRNMFENPLLTKFLKNLSDDATIASIKKIMINEYWSMSSETAGLSQYILCILTNIYFGIIMRKSKYYNNETFINSIKDKIIPNTLLMAVGIFTFKNYIKYNWYRIPERSSCGEDVVNKFLATNKKITLIEWTADYTSTSIPIIIEPPIIVQPPIEPPIIVEPPTEYPPTDPYNI